jgi:hypothetical protein
MTTLIAVEDDLLRNHDLEDLGVRAERPADHLEPVPAHRRHLVGGLLRGMAARLP